MTRLFAVALFSAGAVAAVAPTTPAPRHYAVVLEEPPVAKRISGRNELRSQRALDQFARVEAAQASFKQHVSGRNVRMLGSMKTLMNAVLVAMPESEAAVLRSLRGVQAVVPLRQARLHLNAAAQAANLTAAWSSLAGAAFTDAGAGVKIAIIDSGIDVSHPAFQGSSLQPPAGFPVCSADVADCSAYTNGKVIVARSYMKIVSAGYTENPAETSQPDDYSPRDRVGHGTAVAMAAAGLPVTSPLATITGAAPKAWVGNYKVYGSPGINGYWFSTAALLQALDDAVTDGMQVVNLSLGFPARYGPGDKGGACGYNDTVTSCEPEAAAVEEAVAMGVTVVTSAGDSGESGLKAPTLGTISTPGIAPSAITVGGARNQHELYSSLRISGTDAPGSLASVRAVFGDGPQLDKPLTAPLRDAGGLACDPLPAGSLANAIAVIQRGNCSFWQKVIRAQDAGAAGVVLYCADTEYCADGGDVLFTPVGLTSTAIPTALAGRTDGTAIRQYAAAHADAQATLDPALTEVADARSATIAAFASRGPSIAPGTGIKPEIVAPASQIYTATQKRDANSDMYDPSGFRAVDGTSFSAPLVTGVAALVKQKNPSWTPAQIKSAIVNTARDLERVTGIERITGGGAGMLDADAAVRADVTVEPSTVAFGVLTPTSMGSFKTLKITNFSNSPLALAVVPRDADSRGAISLSQTSIPAGQTAQIKATLGGSMPYAGSYSGTITVTGGAVALRVPYHYIVGDNRPDNVIPLSSPAPVAVAGDRVPGWITNLRVIDQYGAPVAGAPVLWTTTGGAYIEQDTYGNLLADTQTFNYGASAARIFLGGTPGLQTINARIGAGTSGPVFTFNATARPEPVISTGGVVNAASFAAANGNNPAIAPGSYVAIYGTNLSDTTLVYDRRLAPGFVFLPVALADVAVSFDVPGTAISVPGHIHFVSPGQVNVQVPWELQGQSTAVMKVSIGGISTALYTLSLADAAPGIFQYQSPGGTWYAAAQNYPGYALIGPSAPAKRGPDNFVILYVNGLGPVNNQPASGELSASDASSTLKNSVTVTIGGKTAQVGFAGLTPQSLSLYQLNVQIPGDAPSGTQPVIVTVNGNVSQTANIVIE